MERREDPQGNSIYLFFLTRNKIESRAVDALIDWMNSWIDIVLNQRKFSRFVDKEVTSALLGFYALKSVGRLRIEVDTDKLVGLISEFVTETPVSAVGHKSTADLLTKLLGFEVAYNRVQVRLEKNDVALVFQLLTRLEEGRVLTEEELKNISYKLYLVEVG
jgi:hypothetical protein